MFFDDAVRTPSDDSHDVLETQNRPLPPHEQLPQQKPTSFIAETLKFALIALLIVAPIRFFVAQPFIVSGASMEPAFMNGDYLIVDELSYRFEEISRGDVVVFRLPVADNRFLIKRVIGLPGETVTIRGSRVFVTAPESDEPQEVAEWYVANEGRDYGSLSVTLGAEEYFVMGDNRSVSSDSRAWGPLAEENIVGRAFIRLLPFDSISVFPGTQPDQTEQ